MAQNFACSVMVKCYVASAENLVAKDMGGTSDPFITIGFANEEGSLIGKKFKSAVVKKDLNPFFVWPEHLSGPITPEMSAVLVEVWDKDFIGSDDFMGMALIPLSSFVGEEKPNFVTRFKDVQLKPRPGKGDKDRVTGSIKLAFVFHTKQDIIFMEEEKKEAERKKAEERAAQLKQIEENKRRQEEEKRVAEQAAKDKAAAEKEEKRQQAFTEAERVASDKFGVDLIKEFATAALASGVDPKKPITDPIKLYEILAKAGLADRALKSSYFGLDLAKTVRIKQDSSLDLLKVDTERLFQLFDISGDGKVDFQELLFGLAQISEGSMEEKAAFFFDSFDKDKNGCLDCKEVTAILKLIVQRMLVSLYALLMAEFKAQETVSRTENEKIASQLAQVACKQTKEKVDVDSMARTFADLFIAKEGDKMSKSQFIEKTSSKEFQRQMQDLVEIVDNKIVTQVKGKLNSAVEDIRRRYHTVRDLRLLIQAELPSNKYDFASALRG